MTDPAPLLLVLGPLAGAFLAAAVLWSDRRPPPARITARPMGTVAELRTTVVVHQPAVLPDWVRRTVPADRTAPTVTLPWRRNPLHATWPEPPPHPRRRRAALAAAGVCENAWQRWEAA